VGADHDAATEQAGSVGQIVERVEVVSERERCSTLIHGTSEPEEVRHHNAMRSRQNIEGLSEHVAR